METQDSVMDEFDRAGLEQVIAYTFPFDRVHDIYQEYYRASLISALSQQKLRLQEKSGSLFPFIIRRLRTIKDSYRLNRMAAGRIAVRSAHGAARLLTRGPLSCPVHPVGQYVFRFHGFDMKIAIDSNDPGTILRPDLLSESDIYFKTNYRLDIDYPSKVHALPNANPLVLRHLELARALRSTPRDYDLFAFFRVRGGKDELEGIEHNIALFEILGRVNCKKQLTAYVVTGDVTAISRRLERAGVACRTEPMPLNELWGKGSRARLHIVRHGMHDCVPWRMMDVLAQGGCPVLDFPISTKWPHPLIERLNYLQLNARDTRHTDAREVAERVENWLYSPGLTDAISSNNVKYFDEYLHPFALGNYICEVVKAEARLLGYGHPHSPI
jgi:hypothetical protein